MFISSALPPKGEAECDLRERNLLLKDNTQGRKSCAPKQPNPGKGKRKTKANVKQKVKLVKYRVPEINVLLTRHTRVKERFRNATFTSH